VLPDYSDIRSRITEEPTWFDARGVPRYGEFSPRMLGVYDMYALLAEIECQMCHETFLIGEGAPRHDFSALAHGGGAVTSNSLERLIKGFSYGDPPRHGGCAGETMTSDTVAIRVAATTLSVGDEVVGDQIDGEWYHVPDLEGDYDVVYAKVEDSPVLVLGTFS
jgi:hypothetical protein